MFNEGITKREGLIIKGIALIMMFFHHFFTFTEFYIDVISYPMLEQVFVFLQQPFKICVSVFAFLTGFFYYFNCNKNYRYSFKKIFNLWLTYFVCFIVLAVPAILTKKYEINGIYFLLESIGFIRQVMCFCWYVIFYYIAMLIMPLFAKVDNENSVIALAILIIVPNFLGVFTSRLNLENKVFQLVREVLEYTKWLPCVGSGYVFAKYNLLDKMFGLINEKNKVVKTIVFLPFIIIPFIARGGNTFFDFIYAPMFVFGILGIIRMIKREKLLRPFEHIGSASLLMWFLHGAFFNVIGVYTKKILYFPKCPFLVLVWGLIVCYVVAISLRIPINWILKKANRLFNKVGINKKEENA